MRSYKSLKGIAGICFALIMISVLVVTTCYSSLLEYLPDAVKDKSYFLINVCLIAGADINKYDRDDRTPLIEAVKNNDQEMVKYLIEKGAKVNVRGGSILADYPLAVAIKSNFSKMAEYLVENGADLGKTSIHKPDGHVPYTILALKKSTPELLDFLLKKGLDPNKTDEHGKTPIFHAIENNKLEFIKVLLKNNVDINLESYQRTPLMKAVEEGNEKVAGWLVKKGANPTIICADWEKNKFTALSIAKKSRKKKMIRIVRYSLKKWKKLKGQ